MTDHASRELLRQRLPLSEDDLLAQLADEVVAFMGALDDRRKRDIARAWLDAHLQALRERICGDPGVAAARADGDALIEAAAILDLVASVVGELPAATVSVILIRRGLDALCG